MIKDVNYKFIGIIKTPFNSKEGMPIQPTGAKGINGVIEINPEFAEGLTDLDGFSHIILIYHFLTDLDGFSHIILIYHFHKADNFHLMVKPFMDDKEHGVFSTRAPKRPNSIGLSVVKLNHIEGNLVYVENIDVLNETPLLDIKPLIPDVDFAEVDKLGWLEGKSNKMGDKKADNRF